MHKIEVNVETGEVKEIELTKAEIAALEAAVLKEEQDRILALEIAEQAKIQKAELLAKLGITEDEAKLLLS